MFAVPEHTVLSTRALPPLTPTALVRAVAATSVVPGPVPVDDPRVRVWASHLPPGHRATLSYDAGQGAFAVLSGAVTERSGGRTLPLRPGQVRVFGPGYHHEVHNTGTTPVLAVHIQIRLGRAR